MDLQEYLARMNSGEPVQGGGDMHRFMREINEVTMRLTCELNNKYHTGEEVREIFSKIIGKPVDKSFRLFPPFYPNCGKNITVGKGVFINTGCHFQDQGGITLGDGTFLGNNVVLTTMNHDFDPEQRSTTYPAPIVTGKNVWIGSSVTVVPGVTIGGGHRGGRGGRHKRRAPLHHRRRRPRPRHPQVRPQDRPPALHPQKDPRQQMTPSSTTSPCLSWQGDAFSVLSLLLQCFDDL